MVRPSARGRIRPLPEGASSTGTVVDDEIDWPTNAVPGGGVTVEDEGTPLATVATTLDFVGAAVTASGTGTTKTITITSGGDLDDLADVDTTGVADGDVLTYDSGTSEWVAAAPGGGPGGGDFVLLESHTASSSATLDFTAAISSTYDTYLVVLEGVQPATNTNQLSMRVSTNGGSSYDTGSNYMYARRYHYPATGNGLEGSASATSLDPVGGSHDNSHQGIAGYIWLHNPLDTQYKTITFRCTRWVASGLNVPVSDDGVGQYTSNTGYDAVRFFFSSGNIASGTIRIYGLAK